MKNKGLAFFTIGTLLLVSFVAFDFWNERNKEEKKAQEAQLLTLSKDEIADFEIIRNGPLGANQSMTVTKEEGIWYLQTPIHDLADQGAVSDFVEASTLEKHQRVIKEGNDIDWKIYGLDLPMGRVIYKTKDGKKVYFDVSTQKNYMNDHYIRKNDENRVYLASSTWLARVQKVPYDFRDKRILRFPYADIQKINVKNGSDQYQVSKVDGTWKSLSNTQWNLDQTLTGELATQFLTSNVTEFTIDKKPTVADKMKFQLKPMGLHYVLSRSNDKEWKAEFFTNDKKEFFIETSDPERLVKISNTDIQKFSEKKLITLRDRKGPFSFTKEEGQKLIIFDIQTGKKTEIHPDKADSAIRQLKQGQVSEFDLKYSQDKLVDFLEVINKDGISVFKLMVARQAIGKMRPVKTNLFDDIIGIDEELLKKLEIDKLLGKEEKSQKE